MAGLIIVLLVIVLTLVAKGVRIINQYERGVVFRLGRVRGGIKEPGMRLLIPMVDQMRKVSLQIVTLPVDSQKIITKDNVSIDVAAVAYYQVKDPIKAIVAAAAGMPLDLLQRLVISPCSISALLFTAGGPVVLCVNSTGTLNELALS